MAESCELTDEDRDRFALLLVVRSGHLHCIHCAKRECARKNERDPGEEPRSCSACVDSGLIRVEANCWASAPLAER